MRRALAALAITLLLAGCPAPKPKAVIEYVIVKYPENRTVYIDGKENGKTNEVLRVSPNTYVFDLGAPADYQPASQKALVKDATILLPLVIEFKKKSGT